MFSNDFVRPYARACVVAVLIAGLLDLPALAALPYAGATLPSAAPLPGAAADKALGVVIQSQVSRMGQSNLAVGTSVYAGDSVWTDVGGTLRMKVGSGLMYLLASSAMTLGQEDGTVQATLARGTAGFSATPKDKIELLVPQGIVRAADGQPGYGQVTILSEKDVVIAAYRGTLVLDNAGELHMIAAGSAYRVTILDDDAQKQEGSDTQEYPTTHAKKRRRRLLVALFFMGGAGIGSYFLYEELTESPSSF
jgi:hypothetical protein